MLLIYNSNVSVIYNHIINYLIFTNLNYFFGFGSFTGMMLVIQILIGFFLVVYTHIFRGLYYGLFIKPRNFFKKKINPIFSFFIITPSYEYQNKSIFMIGIVFLAFFLFFYFLKKYDYKIKILLFEFFNYLIEFFFFFHIFSLFFRLFFVDSIFFKFICNIIFTLITTFYFKINRQNVLVYLRKSLIFNQFIFIVLNTIKKIETNILIPKILNFYQKLSIVILFFFLFFSIHTFIYLISFYYQEMLFKSCLFFIGLINIFFKLSENFFENPSETTKKLLKKNYVNLSSPEETIIMYSPKEAIKNLFTKIGFEIKMAGFLTVSTAVIGGFYKAYSGEITANLELQKLSDLQKNTILREKEYNFAVELENTRKIEKEREFNFGVEQENTRKKEKEKELTLKEREIFLAEKQYADLKKLND